MGSLTRQSIERRLGRHAEGVGRLNRVPCNDGVGSGFGGDRVSVTDGDQSQKPRCRNRSPKDLNGFHGFVS